MNKIDNNTILDKYKEISKLNIEEIYNKFKDFDNDKLRNLSSIAKKNFDWKNIFEYIFSK